MTGRPAAVRAEVGVVRKMVVLVGSALALSAVVRRRRGRDDEDLWAEATRAADLR